MGESAGLMAGVFACRVANPRQARFPPSPVVTGHGLQGGLDSCAEEASAKGRPREFDFLILGEVEGLGGRNRA